MTIAGSTRPKKISVEKKSLTVVALAFDVYNHIFDRPLSYLAYDVVVVIAPKIFKTLVAFIAGNNGPQLVDLMYAIANPNPGTITKANFTCHAYISGYMQGLIEQLRLHDEKHFGKPKENP